MPQDVLRGGGLPRILASSRSNRKCYDVMFEGKREFSQINWDRVIQCWDIYIGKSRLDFLTLYHVFYKSRSSRKKTPIYSLIIVLEKKEAQTFICIQFKLQELEKTLDFVVIFKEGKRRNARLVAIHPDVFLTSYPSDKNHYNCISDTLLMSVY